MVVDRDQHRLDLALAHGATDGFRGRADEARTWLAELTDGQDADVVYDVTGHAAVFASALKLVKRNGTLLLMGDTPQPNLQHLTHDVLARQITIKGTHSAQLSPAFAEWTRERQIRLFLDFIARGDMDVAGLVDHRLAPDALPALYTAQLDGPLPYLGVLVDWP
jgi:threonine dehydrogenase-like Zn-dependent dehydrogenase